MKIYLDDIRNSQDSYSYTGDKRYLDQDWSIVRSYDSFVKTISELDFNSIKLISLDHDLADEHYFTDDNPWSTQDSIDYFSYQEKTGYDCAKWLCDYCLERNYKLPEILVHSFNQVGSENIKRYIQNFKKHTQ